MRIEYGWRGVDGYRLFFTLGFVMTAVGFGLTALIAYQGDVIAMQRDALQACAEMRGIIFE